MSLPEQREFVDRFTPGEAIHFQIREVLYEGRSPFQDIQVLDLVGPGRTLLLDDNMQSAERDEHLYHEALIHPALLSTAGAPPAKVLILGGGEGATLREILKHRSVSRVVMVDLDRQVVDVCKQHLPQHHAGAFDDPRADVRYQDAEQFLRETDELFDVIVFDIIDPAEDGPACHLFADPFLKLMRQHLAPGGVLAMQYGPVFNEHVTGAARLLQRLESLFSHLLPGSIYVPSFHGSWGILLSAEHPLPMREELLEERLRERLGVELKSLDAPGIMALFTAPKQLRDLL